MYSYLCDRTLGLKTFDLATQEQIERWVCGQAAEGLSPAEIFPHAEETLRLWDVVLPARSTLERLVASQVTGAQEQIFQRLSARLSPECRTDLDSLLEVGGDHHPRSALLRLKEYPPEATAATILSYLEQYALLRSLQVERIDVSGLSPELTLQLAALVKRYDAWTLKRFAEPKRHAMLACFLTEAQKTVLDHLAEMHDRLLTKIWGRSQRAFEERHRELRRRAKEGLDQLVAAVEFLLDPYRSRETTLAELCRQVNEEELQAALASCRAFQHLEERGFVDEISSYYSYLRRYFPSLFELPFEAEPGSRSLLEALAIVRRLDRGELGKLPCRHRSILCRPPGENSCCEPTGYSIGERGRSLWGLLSAMRSAQGIFTCPRVVATSRSGIWFTTNVNGPRSAAVPTNSCLYLPKPTR
jgi:hypothetical protein